MAAVDAELAGHKVQTHFVCTCTPTILGCQMVVEMSLFNHSWNVFSSPAPNVSTSSRRFAAIFPLAVQRPSLDMVPGRLSPGTLPSIAFSKDPIFDHHKVQVREVVQHALLPDERCWELGVNTKNMKFTSFLWGVLYGEWLKMLQKGCTCSFLKSFPSRNQHVNYKAAGTTNFKRPSSQLHS